jgi:hypothetical protein
MLAVEQRRCVAGCGRRHGSGTWRDSRASYSMSRSRFRVGEATRPNVLDLRAPTAPICAAAVNCAVVAAAPIVVLAALANMAHGAP